MEYVTYDICIDKRPGSPQKEAALYSSFQNASHMMECALNYFIVNDSEYLTSVTASFGCLQKPNRVHSFIFKKQQKMREGNLGPSL